MKASASRGSELHHSCLRHFRCAGRVNLMVNRVPGHALIVELRAGGRNPPCIVQKECLGFLRMRDRPRSRADQPRRRICFNSRMQVSNTRRLVQPVSAVVSSRPLLNPAQMCRVKRQKTNICLVATGILSYIQRSRPSISWMFFRLSVSIFLPLSLSCLALT